MTYDPSQPDFFDEAALRRELDRVNDLCAGCRRCLPLCPSFPALFDAIDAEDGDVTKVSDASLREVVDLCFQCKLCYPHCPYTPDQGHRWNIDFPRLMLRAKAARAKREGVTFQDRCMGDPDLAGRIGSAFAPISNWANRFPPNRFLMEKVIGIHRGRRLPIFHRQSFERWWRKRPARPAPKEAPARSVTLFPTCFVNWNDPETGRASVAVLEHNGCEVSCPTTICCGMPYLDGGDMEGFHRNAEANLAVLGAEVEAGRDVVVPGPTCSYVIRNEYPSLHGGDVAKRVAEHTFDLCEYLIRMKKKGDLDTNFEGKIPKKILYHLPCHLKVQKIGFRSRDVLKLLPGAEVQLVDKCSAMDGTWGMKVQYYEQSKSLAEPLLQDVRESGADAVVSDCPLSCIQIAEGTGTRPVHPVLVLRDAYGLAEDTP